MRRILPFLALALLAPGLSAQQRSSAGPIIHSAGAVFAVPSPDFATRPDQEYKVAFEIAGAASQPDRLNQSLNTAARFLNMHGQAGVPSDQVSVAVVVHGGASFEMLDNAAYREKFGVDNPNAELIRELTSAGARVVLCGQSAASRGVAKEDMIDGVEIALSAMTAFVMLQHDGYLVNPW